LKLTASQVLAALADLKPSPSGSFRERLFEGLSIDSRQIRPGQLFVAIQGERFDGHDFVGLALERGALAAVVRAGWAQGQDLPREAPLIETADTLRALGRLARYWRLRHQIPVLAVSGSMGKSTVKEMIAAIVGRRRRVLKNEGNLNNLVGLPLTLLEMDETVQAAVVELGISLKGEMEELVDIARPQVGLLTNVAPVHLEGLGGLEGIAEAKTALWRGLGPEGTAVVNLDDELLRRAAGEFKGRRLTFGRAAEADVRLIESGPANGQGLQGTLEVAGRRYAFSVPALGRFQALNAAAAAAGALALGAPPEDVAPGLAGFAPLKHRLRTLVGRQGINVLDDAYNANPVAMVEALDSLRRLCPGRARAAAILGQMAELGPEGLAAHQELGRAAAGAGLSLLVALGPLAEVVVEEARRAGLSQAHVAREPGEAVEIVLDRLKAGDWVLVKGSRVARLERAVAALTGEGGAG